MPTERNSASGARRGGWPPISDVLVDLDVVLGVDVDIDGDGDGDGDVSLDAHALTPRPRNNGMST